MPTYKRFSEQAILIEWPSEINEMILSDVLIFKQKIENVLGHQINEVRSAYQSLLVIYETHISDLTEAVLELKKINDSDENFKPVPLKLWKIPVCYDDDFGLDLDDMSQSKKMSKNDIIKLHTEAIYTVYFIGFLPGFLYLGGLDERLFTARKATPRMQIHKGAVAIGGNQTGVYPKESPGGWNIIGNSPIDFFNSKSERPCFAQAGDRIQFYPVSMRAYREIQILVDAKVYQIEIEVGHD